MSGRGGRESVKLDLMQSDETWVHGGKLDVLSDEESRARHGRMMARIGRRIDFLRDRIRAEQKSKEVP